MNLYFLLTTRNPFVMNNTAFDVSCTPVVNRLTARKLLKLHSSDMAFLKILRHFHEKGSGASYLSSASWPEYLVRFGGKALQPLARKLKSQKLRSLGLVVMYRQQGSPSLPAIFKITELGLKDLYEFEKNNTAKLKNHTAKCKKTIPLINIRSKHENNDHTPYKRNQTNQPINLPSEVVQNLKEWGMYPSVIRKLSETYSLELILKKINLASNPDIFNKGAYITKSLQNTWKVISKEISRAEHKPLPPEEPIINDLIHVLEQRNKLRQMFGKQSIIEND